MQGVGPDQLRKGAQGGDEIAHRLILIAPRYWDAVFRAFQPTLQSQEVLVRLRSRKTLLDHHQPANHAGQPVLGGLELLEAPGR